MRKIDDSMINDRRKITIYDISKRLNLSAATVSRALNNIPGTSEKTRELVAKAATDMNYNRNPLAQALKSGRTNKVGVIVPFINRRFCSSVIRGIEEELTLHGYHVIICQSHGETKNEVKQVTSLMNTQIDGIFMSVSKATEKANHIRKAREEKIPVIFFDKGREILGTSLIAKDDYLTGFMATEHLIKLGCKRIAHISKDVSLPIYKSYFEGYKAALEKHGIDYRPDYVIKSRNEYESGASAESYLWSLNLKPDGLFSAGEYFNFKTNQELKFQNLEVSDQICVVRLRNEPSRGYLELPISSISHTPQFLGKIAAQVFLEQVRVIKA